jgi:hypothetical protein
MIRKNIRRGTGLRRRIRAGTKGGEEQEQK